MNILIVYYTRSGMTRSISNYLAEKLNCESLEIKTSDSRKGLAGYLTCAKEVIAKTLPPISLNNIDLNSFDLILIGTPVWAGTMASPIRTFISENKDKFKNVAFFSTQGSEKEQSVFQKMEELINLKPKQTLFVSNKELNQKSFHAKTDAFIKNIK